MKLKRSETQFVNIKNNLLHFRILHRKRRLPYRHSCMQSIWLLWYGIWFRPCQWGAYNCSIHCKFIHFEISDIIYFFNIIKVYITFQDARTIANVVMQILLFVLRVSAQVSFCLLIFTTVRQNSFIGKLPFILHKFLFIFRVQEWHKLQFAQFDLHWRKL